MVRDFGYPVRQVPNTEDQMSDQIETVWLFLKIFNDLTDVRETLSKTTDTAQGYR